MLPMPPMRLRKQPRALRYREQRRVRPVSLLALVITVFRLGR